MLKSANEKTYSSFSAAAKEHKQLFYNDAGILLAMATADDALFGYNSLEDIRKQKIPAGQDELVLRFKDSALNRPDSSKMHENRWRRRRPYAQKFIHQHLQKHSNQCRVLLWSFYSRNSTTTGQGR